MEPWYKARLLSAAGNDLVSDRQRFQEKPHSHKPCRRATRYTDQTSSHHKSCSRDAILQSGYQTLWYYIKFGFRVCPVPQEFRTAHSVFFLNLGLRRHVGGLKFCGCLYGFHCLLLSSRLLFTAPPPPQLTVPEPPTLGESPVLIPWSVGGKGVTQRDWGLWLYQWNHLCAVSPPPSWPGLLLFCSLYVANHHL